MPVRNKRVAVVILSSSTQACQHNPHTPRRARTHSLSLSLTHTHTLTGFIRDHCGKQSAPVRVQDCLRKPPVSQDHARTVCGRCPRKVCERGHTQRRVRTHTYSHTLTHTHRETEGERESEKQNHLFKHTLTDTKTNPDTNTSPHINARKHMRMVATSTMSY